jgi:hypothetical protein
MLLRRHTARPAAQPEPAEPEPEEPEPGEPDGEAFDPEQHTVNEVLAYVDKHSDAAQGVYVAEAAADKPRSTLLQPLEDLLAADGEDGEHADEPDPED